MFSRFARRTFIHGRRAFSTSTARVVVTKKFLATSTLFGTMGYTLYNNSGTTTFAAKTLDYGEIKQAIADILDVDNYDDGSYGPVFVRLGWHASGTYSKYDKSGGSNKASMRFKPESAHGANAGLDVARNVLESNKKKYPELSYGDLWTLAACTAIEEMGGPKINWRPGRIDGQSSRDCTPDGRLPDAAQGQDHVRDIFYRMGFNDQEIVALAGAHSIGRCHTKLWIFF